MKHLAFPDHSFLILSAAAITSDLQRRKEPKATKQQQAEEARLARIREFEDVPHVIITTGTGDQAHVLGVTPLCHWQFSGSINANLDSSGGSAGRGNYVAECDSNASGQALKDVSGHPFWDNPDTEVLSVTECCTNQEHIPRNVLLDPQFIQKLDFGGLMASHVHKHTPNPWVLEADTVGNGQCHNSAFDYAQQCVVTTNNGNKE